MNEEEKKENKTWELPLDATDKQIEQVAHEMEKPHKESKWKKYILWILLAIFIIVLIYGIVLVAGPTIEAWFGYGVTGGTTTTTITGG